VDLYLSRPVGRVALLLSRYSGGLLLAAANLVYLIGSIWLIIIWKTHVVHARFLLGGVTILFTIAVLLAFAFLIGVVTSSTGVSLMATYAVFFLAAMLSAHDKIGAALSAEWAAKLVNGLYWVFPKTAELGRATVEQVSGGRLFHRAPVVQDLFAVYGSTAIFGLAVLAFSCWLFSRKDF
jgi:hypothetical protein